MIYTVTLNPAIDYVVRLDRLTPGALNRNEAEEFEYGGKGINVSRMLHNLGLESIALGFIAGFTGDGLERGLADMGLAADLIRVSKGMTRINVKIKAEEETEINGLGPVITAADMAALYEKLDALGEGDVLVLSGSVPACLPPDTYGRILARLAGRGVTAVVDAAGPLLTGVLEHRPFLIKPNDKELGAIFGRDLVTEAEIVECARLLQSRGARNVLVSMAGDGAILLDEAGGVHRCACPAGTVINSVGAGDSMVAGFLAGWLGSRDCDAALRLGVAAGSATAFSIGIGERALVEDLLAQTVPGKSV